MLNKDFFCNDCLNYKPTFDNPLRRDGYCEKRGWTLHRTLAACVDFSVKRIERFEAAKEEKRLFPRITKEMDIYIKNLQSNESEVPYKTRSASISEGGLSFIVPENLPIVNGDRISLEFQFDGSLKSMIRVNATVVHVTEQFLDDGTPFSSAGVSFSDILEYDKLKIREEVSKYLNEK